MVVAVDKSGAASMLPNLAPVPTRIVLGILIAVDKSNPSWKRPEEGVIVRGNWVGSVEDTNAVPGTLIVLLGGLPGVVVTEIVGELVKVIPSCNPCPPPSLVGWSTVTLESLDEIHLAVAREDFSPITSRCTSSGTLLVVPISYHCTEVVLLIEL